MGAVAVVESLSMYLVVAKPFFHHHERVKRERERERTLRGKAKSSN